jgi:threonine/homoserine/homoserine lactone efflux protein
MFNLAAFLSYVIVVTYTPGPNNIMSMANASQYGFKQTLRFMFGVLTGGFFLVLSSCYFNLLLFNLIPRIKTVMGIIGAAYMVYLAIKIMKSKPSGDNDKKGSLNFTTGVLLQFINPKFLLYAVTVTSNFVVPYYNSHFQLIMFSAFLAVTGFSSLALWALFGSGFKKFLSDYHRPFNIAMGLLLMYSAVSISGIMHMFK